MSRFNPIYMEPGSIQINSTRDLQILFPNSFDRIGDMSGEYNIKIEPLCTACTTWEMQGDPLNTRLRLRKELNDMIHQGIIAKQMELPPWVSSLTYPKKPNGKLRICLDPMDLNKVITQRASQSTNSGRDCSHDLTRSNKILKSRWKQGIFQNAPYRASVTAHNIQHTPR